MKVTIYQINSDRDFNRMMFMSYDRLERLHGSSEVDCKIYDKIYESEVSCNNLEEIYRMFNMERPEDFKGHSLSVSDVVEVSESKTIAAGFYFCDSFGFQKVAFDPTLCEVSERINEPVSKIKVLLVEPNKFPKMIEIADSLEAMQALVGGDIEEYMPFEDEVAIICNEEGKINGLPLNRAIYDSDNQMIEIMAGDFFICHAPISSEKFLSLPPDLIKKYFEKFRYPEKFVRTDDGIKAIPYKPVARDMER